MRTLYLILFLFLFSCGGGKSAQDSGSADVSEIVSEAPAEVSVVLLEPADFSYNLISNGVVSARHSAEMCFRTQELIRAIHVRNGQRVSKGQKLAELDLFTFRNNFAQAEEALERAKLDLQDVLIGQGYTLNDSDAIPAEVMKIARIRSNYQQSNNTYQVAKHDLETATLYAPFDGVVANLTAKTHNLPGNDPFCTVIDTSNPDVVFHILENELPYVAVGDRVYVSAFSAPERESAGRITEINPVVGKNGMVRVAASVHGGQAKLCEGMNVRVRIERLLGKRLVVPKSAVVLRTNKQVVFTLKNGRAIWNYVATAQENASQYVISEGLHPGDSVICAGNLNLAHEAPVFVTK